MGKGKYIILIGNYGSGKTEIALNIAIRAAARGEHIPPFLIASITTRCNLHCKGCYARANHNCTDSAAAEAQLLSPDDWARIFDEAAELGVAFILLAGGSCARRSCVRQDVSGG